MGKSNTDQPKGRVELQEFVSEVLVQVSAAIDASNERVRDGLSREELLDKPRFILRQGASQEHGEGIHFDVAITAESGKTGRAGGGFSIGVVEAKAGGDLTTSESNVTRVQFTVGVAMTPEASETEQAEIDEATAMDSYVV